MKKLFLLSSLILMPIIANDESPDTNVARLKHENAVLKVTVEQFEEELAKQKNDFINLTTEHTASKKTINDLEETIENYENLVKIPPALEEKLGGLQNEMQQTLARMTEENEEYYAKMINAQAELEKTQAQLTALETTHKEAITDITSISKKLAKVEGQYETLQKEYYNQGHDLTNEITAKVHKQYAKQLQNQEEELKKAQDAMALAQQDATTATTLATTLRTEVATLQKKHCKDLNKELEQENERLADQNNEQIGQIKTLTQSNKTLTTNLEEASTDRDTANAKLLSLQEKCKPLSDEITKLKNELQIKVEDLSNKEEKITSLTEKNQELTVECQSASSGTSAHCDLEIAQKESEIEELQKEIETLKQGSQDSEALKTKIKQLTNELNAAKAAAEAAKKAQEEADQKAQKAKAEKLKIEKELENLPTKTFIDQQLFVLKALNTKLLSIKDIVNNISGSLRPHNTRNSSPVA